MSKSVPDKWLDYKSHGTVINGTKILPFKVPLKEGVCKNLQDEQRFTTAMLIKAFPNLKYIVDLTNTNRYYDNGDFSKVGVKYQKVMIPGIQVPSLEYVKRFFKAMDIFTKECKDDEIIGVHCTHGVNRTGYLICRYLVQQLGWKLNDALKEFKEARGHGIERTNYTTDLKRVPAGQKIDVSNVKLSTPVAKSKNPKNRSKRAGLRPPRPLFPMGPPRPMPPGRRNAFVNGGPPFPPGPPPPPPHFGPGPNTGFGPRHLPPGPPPLVPPVSRGPPPPPPPPMFGRPRAGRFGRMPPGPPMRSPPLPPPPPPRPMSGPPGMPPRMAPRLPPLLRQPVPPPLLPPVPLPVAKGPIRPLLRSGGRNQKKATKEQDFTADTFEENLAAKVPSRRRKRPYPGCIQNLGSWKYMEVERKFFLFWTIIEYNEKSILLTKVIQR